MHYFAVKKLPCYYSCTELIIQVQCQHILSNHQMQTYIEAIAIANPHGAVVTFRPNITLVGYYFMMNIESNMHV